MSPAMKAMRRVWLIGALLATAAPALAALDEAAIDAALARKDHAEAYRMVSEAARGDDLKARAWLAYFQFNGIGVARNTDQACPLAKQTAEAGAPLGAVVLARCLLEGRKSVDEARTWARRAAAAGFPEGKMLVGMAYLLDPRFNAVGADGRVDRSRYEALGKRGPNERLEQVEAIEGLAQASVTLDEARDLLSAVLFESAGPGLTREVAEFGKRYQSRNTRVTRMHAMAAQVLQLGDTVSSPKLVMDAMPSVQMAAVSAAGGAAESCREARLISRRMSDGPRNAVYLPLATPALKNRILLQGQWSEQWNFDLCGTRQSVLVNFDADGMGGAHYVTGRKK